MKFSSLSLIAALVFTLVTPEVLGVALYTNGNASKACTKIRTPKDYDDPVDGIVPANPDKGMSMDSDRNSLPNPKKNVWTIDSSKLTTSNLKPVNDKGTHWAITLTEATEIGKLLDDINNAGWTKV